MLEEIRAEKKRLIKEGGKLKKSAIANESRIFRGDDNRYHQNINGEDIIIDDFLPFEIPSTWRWISLGELVADRTGLSYKKENLSDRTEPFIRVLRGGNIEDGELMMKADDVFISSSYVAPDLLLKKGQYISPAVSSLEKIGKTLQLAALLDQPFLLGAYFFQQIFCRSFRFYLRNESTLNGFLKN